MFDCGRLQSQLELFYAEVNEASAGDTADQDLHLEKDEA